MLIECPKNLHFKNCLTEYRFHNESAVNERTNSMWDVFLYSLRRYHSSLLIARDGLVVRQVFGSSKHKPVVPPEVLTKVTEMSTLFPEIELSLREGSSGSLPSLLLVPKIVKPKNPNV